MVRHRYAVAAGAAIALLVSSCALFAPQFSVVLWSPREARISDPGSIEIWIRFSGPANRESTEQAFSLTKDGGSVFGSFSWTGDVMSFSPAERFEPGSKYEIALAPGAEDERGVSLDEEFRFAFSTKAEDGRPSIVSVEPAEGASLDNRFAPIAMIFSEAVDRASLYAAFALSPSARGRFDWTAGDSACTFVPLEPYAWQTDYEIVIRNGLVDLSANPIAKPYKSRFRVGVDGAAPTVVRVANAVGGVEGSVALKASLPSDAGQVFTAGWESTWGLALTFSEPVEREGLESQILIEPAWSYAIDDTAALGSSFVLQPRERLVRDTLYSITIRKGLKDARGNATAEETVYKVRVDGKLTASPAIVRLRFRTNPEGFCKYFAFCFSCN